MIIWKVKHLCKNYYSLPITSRIPLEYPGNKKSVLGQSNNYSNESTS